MIFESVRVAVGVVLLGSVLSLSCPSEAATKYSIKKLSVTYNILQTNGDHASVTNQTIVPFYPDPVAPPPPGASGPFPVTITFTLGPISDDKRDLNNTFPASMTYGFYKRVEIQAQFMYANDKMHFDWLQQRAGIVTVNGATNFDSGHNGTDWVADGANYATNKIDDQQRVYHWDSPGFPTGATQGPNQTAQGSSEEFNCTFRDKVTHLVGNVEYDIGAGAWSAAWPVHVKIQAVQQQDGTWAWASVPVQ